MTARETLRAELLTSGLSEEVPLAEVETVINRLELTKTTADAVLWVGGRTARRGDGTCN